MDSAISGLTIPLVLAAFWLGLYVRGALDWLAVRRSYVHQGFSGRVAAQYAARHLRGAPAPRPGCSMDGCLLGRRADA